jgi:Leucine-rich repeat (LRR) protein
MITPFQLRFPPNLTHNYRLRELYMQDNQLSTVTGYLAHLHGLTSLFLHNNQLQKLDLVVREFRHMHGLRYLSTHCT